MQNISTFLHVRYYNIIESVSCENCDICDRYSLDMLVLNKVKIPLFVSCLKPGVRQVLSRKKAQNLLLTGTYCSLLQLCCKPVFEEDRSN